MPRTAVQEILREIDGLVPEDRLALDRELARRLDGKWKLEAAKARKKARARKIDQETIDRVIERRRKPVSPRQLVRLLDELANGPPSPKSLPADFSRTDIYDDHD